MTEDFDRAELTEAIEAILAQDEPEAVIPYIQAGDVEDVFLAIESLGYKLVKE